MSHKTSIATDSSSLHIFLLAYLSYLQNKSFKASRKDPTCLAAINGNGALRSPLCLGISAQMLCEPPVLMPHQHVPVLWEPLALGGGVPRNFTATLKWLNTVLKQQCGGEINSKNQEVHK